jgi:metal-responsive CopG/Arc/MetJ family transcriptional regulator
MKIAISINDALLQEVDEAARLMGLSRSRLFGLAVTDFLRRQRMERMLLQLNEVYAESAGQPLLKKIKTKMRLTIEDRW